MEEDGGGAMAESSRGGRLAAEESPENDDMRMVRGNRPKPGKKI